MRLKIENIVYFGVFINLGESLGIKFESNQCHLDHFETILRSGISGAKWAECFDSKESRYFHRVSKCVELSRLWIF